MRRPTRDYGRQSGPFNTDDPSELQTDGPPHGDLLSARFLGLGAAALASIGLLRALVPVPALAWFAHRARQQTFGLDPNVATCVVGAIVLSGSLVLHALLRDTYVAADRQRIWWRDFLDVGQSEAAWSAVREFLVVEPRRGLVGPEKRSPWLAWVLADGRRVTAMDGNRSSLRPDEIDEAVRFTEAHGVSVRRLVRDE